ncbi:hypothetical protein BD408DRAFT_438748, partial [Parasitella parasitica]
MRDVHLNLQDEDMPQAPSVLPAPESVSSTTSTISMVTSNPIDAVKKLLHQRDQYIGLLIDMIEGTDLDNEQGQNHISEMRAKVEGMNKLIFTLKSSAKLSEANVTSALSGDNEGISLSKQDLPKFQLRSSATKYFPNELTYDSIHHFLRSFEKVILSSGKSVEDVWRRYIPLTIPYDLDLWLNQELLKAGTWSAAKDLFTKKFNNAALRLDARREVQTATMKPGETTEEYYNRFARAMLEAGYSSEDTTLGDTFLLGFPASWQIQINSVLCAQYPGQSDFTANQIVTCALNILNGQKCPISFISVKKGGASRGGGVSPKSSTAGFSSPAGSSPSFFCSNHGGAQARHNEKDCRLNKGASTSRRVDRSNVPKKASGNTFCKWC